MRTVRSGALIGVACIGAALIFNAVNCASATTITLDVRAESEICEQITQTGIAVTTPDNVDNVGDYGLTQFEDGCSAGRVGTLVITPTSSSATDRSARVGIRVVAGLNGKLAADCDHPKGDVGENCFIVKREVTFSEGANVPLSVVLTGKCLGVSCRDNYECEPSNGQCVPRDIISGTSSSGGTEDVFVPPEDVSQPKPDAEAGAPTPEQLCRQAQGDYSAANNSCTITCGPNNVDCKANRCPVNQKCILLCVGKNACKGVNCGVNEECEINCTNGAEEQCHDISCDSGICKVFCSNGTTVCNNVLTVGNANTMSCTIYDGGPSCDNVSCTPGPRPNTTTKCTRTCDGNEALGCGPKFTCDAGDCAAFAGDAGPL